MREISEDFAMSTRHVLCMAGNQWPSSEFWWEREGARSVQAGHYTIIPGRNDSRLYILRMWLSAPKMSVDDRWDSQNSWLLHFMARGDRDFALHNHPWNEFHSTILCGGYQEFLPPKNWDRQSELGPEWDQNYEWHGPGSSVKRYASDLHCVGHAIPGTFTLVRTGERIRDWGFHPPGQRFVPWKTFLGIDP